MPSAFTHAFAAAAMGTVIIPEQRRLIALGALCAVLPDADVLGFGIGVPYQHVLGHRGLSHSLAFAACLAGALTWATVRLAQRSIPVVRLGLFLFLATASHGVFDAMTNGGLGVAFFAPFSGERYFFPWRPIAVSPISVKRFFTGRGVAILANEFLVVWIPALLVAATGAAVRMRATPRSRRR